MVNKNGQNCVNRYQQPPQRLYLKGKRKTPKIPIFESPRNKDGVTNRYPILPLLLPAPCPKSEAEKQKGVPKSDTTLIWRIK